MARKGGRVNSSKYNNSDGNTGGGGIANSGIFGLFGTTIQCDAESDSIYCNIMKLFNILIVTILVVYILYIVYKIAIPFLFKKKSA